MQHKYFAGESRKLVLSKAEGERAGEEMITTAFQPNAFQQTAFQIVGWLDRPDRARAVGQFVGRIPVGSLRVITVRPVKNRRAE